MCKISSIFLRIKTNTVEDAAMLVSKAKEVEGDVTISKGKFCVDGKSLLGVLSLDLRDGVNIEYPAEASDFEEFLRPFMLK